MNLENEFEKDFSAMHERTMELHRDIMRQYNLVVTNALKDNSLDFAEINIWASRVQIVRVVGDRFDHYILDKGLPTEKRVISIERTPKLRMATEPDGAFKMIAEARYY